MLSGKFTILELVDLALRVPEIGAVNFNILHTVLTNIILQTGLEKLKPLCHIQDEVLAQAAITKARMEEERQKGQTERSGKTVAELKDRIKAVDLPKPKRQSVKKIAESSSSEKEDKSKEDISLEDSSSEETLQDETEKDTSVEDVLEEEEPDETEEDMSVDDESEKAETGGDQVPEKVDEVEKVPEVAESDLTLEDDAAKAKGKIEEMMEDLGSLAQDILDETSGEQVTAETLQALADERLVEDEPSQVIAEMWRAININRRMDAAEQGLRELSSIVDVMLDKVQEVEDETVSVVNKTKAMFEGLDNFLKKVKALEEKLKSLEVQLEETNEMTRSEVIRLEEMISEIQSAFDATLSEIEAALKDLESRHSDLEGRVAYKEDVEALRNSGRELLETQVKELKKLIREVQDTIIPKEDFMELVTRVEVVEETKVSREELGRLLEPGFIDNFIAEQESLREDLGELKEFVNEINEDLTALKTRIDEEILKSIEASFADIRSHIETIEEKLATLDADDINDTFARLEEQIVMILKDLEENKAALELYNKEAKSNFKKIQDVNALLDRLETTKADKEKMYEMLALKADIELVGNKLDRSEFVAVIENIKDDVERLTITVKINEEEMNENVLKIRRELSLKMYTEDFITATEPIRNRIKAILCEQRKIKQIALTHLFPDAPGIAKCFSCKRGAKLAGMKYGNGTGSSLKIIETTSGTSAETQQSGAAQHVTSVKLPSIDIDSVPIPPADQPRETDALQLPALFASATPQIGLAHEKRKSVIDKEVSAYFSTKTVRAIDGEYTKTMPQQKGLNFTKVMLPQGKRSEILIKGIDDRIYKGTIHDSETIETDVTSDVSHSADDENLETKQEKSSKPDKEKPDIPSLKEPRTRKGFKKPVIHKPKLSSTRDTHLPAIVSLHVDGKPLQTSPVIIKSNSIFMVPTDQLKSVKKSPGI